MFRLSTRFSQLKNFRMKTESPDLFRKFKNFSKKSFNTEYLLEKWTCFSLVGGMGCGMYYTIHNNDYHSGYYLQNFIFEATCLSFASSILVFYSPIFVPPMAIFTATYFISDKYQNYKLKKSKLYQKMIKSSVSD